MQNCHENPRTLLKKSADVQYYKSHIIAMSVMIACFTVLALVCALGTEEPVFYTVLIPSVLIGGPLIVWYILNLIHIFKNAEGYRFYETTLTHPQSTWGQRLYFLVTVEGRQLETRAVFNVWGLMTPQFNDYSNAAVLIGYNAATEDVVVIPQTERN